MDKELLRYAAGGGAISLFACGLLCMALEIGRAHV